MFDFDNMIGLLFNAGCFYAGHKMGENTAFKEVTMQSQQNEIQQLRNEIEKLKIR